MKWLFGFPLVCICVIANATPISIAEDSDWLPASAEQRAAIPNAPNGEILDLSESKGTNSYAVMILVKYPIEINREGYLGAIEGYENALNKDGQKLTNQHEGHLGKLPGVWLLSEGTTQGTYLYMATLMVFGRTSTIMITIGSADGPLDASSELCRDYLARLSVSADYLPGDILKPAPVNRDRQIGRIIGYCLTPFLLLGIPGLLIYLLSKFMGRSKSATGEPNSTGPAKDPL